MSVIEWVVPPVYGMGGTTGYHRLCEECQTLTVGSPAVCTAAHWSWCSLANAGEGTTENRHDRMPGVVYKDSGVNAEAQAAAALAPTPEEGGR